MTKKTFSLKRLKSGVVVFQYGNYVESFDCEVIGIYETHERIKYAAITAGIGLNDDTMQDLLLEARGLLDD